jgi:proton-dependent oligopeptide transporter, POT family
LSDTPSVVPPESPPSGLVVKARDFVGTLAQLTRAPRAFWFVNLFFMIDSMAYFGMLTLMVPYISKDLGTSDAWASTIVSGFTGLLTILMLGVGTLAEKRGVRRGLLIAAVMCLVGRAAFSSAPFVAATWWISIVVLVGGLVVVAVAEAMIQTVSYAGIKNYTDERNSSVGYGMIYGIGNLGIVLVGTISPLIRVPVDKIHEAGAAGIPESASIWAFFARHGISGVNAVNWACVAISAFALVFFFVCMTKRAEAERVRPPDEAELARQTARAAKTPLFQRIRTYFAEGPFGNARFVFFIFMLLPVQTLFAHQWLTMTPYLFRAYSPYIAERAEWILNWINPGIIFFGSPICAALTRRVNVYKMMIIGSAISALSTFLLVAGPYGWIVISYQVVFSIGEALWQPRFLEYAAELAPEGKVSQYMGLANFPWFLAKATTGLYSGFLLQHYCPEQGPQDTQSMWLIYGIIAVVSPIGLMIGRSWVMRGTMGTPKSAAA